MSEIQVIESALHRAARRRRSERALRGLWRGLGVGAAVWLLALAAYKLFPIPLSVLAAGALATAVCTLAGFIIGGWRKPALDETARWIDVGQHLKERLSTALELSRVEQAGQWRDLVVTDAAHVAKDLDPRRLIHFNLPRSIRWTVLLLALGAGLGFVPEYRSKQHVQSLAEREAMKEAGQRLADLTRRSLEQRKPTLEPTEKAMEATAKIGDQLAKQTLTRADALKDLASAQDKLKEQLRELGKDPALRRLEQAARQPGGGGTQNAEGLQKQMESLQKQVGSQAGNADKIEKLQRDLEKLQQEAAKTLSDKTSAGGDADKAQLAASLAALSKQAEELGLTAPNLDAAIEALAANQTDMFLKDLQAATTDLEKLNQMSKSLQQLQAQMEKMGKDLAEQLKNGQAEAAQATLQKMVDQLKSAKLTPEQLQQLLAEVSKAVDPASPYGKVAEHLKEAAMKMQKGEKNEAAQSLAAAAKELENLIQQLGDAKQLSDTLAALEQASECTGSGNRWAKRPPRAGNGGQPGSGVGTWGDDNNWLSEVPQSAGWDNSGVDRPDTDPYGRTDRGEGAPPDKLTPSKVKGQFSPGGPMPSITLKGVSIKGASKIQFDQAATAAQTDAQSALSQEKVPRAYQGPVRDYFDDLKK